MKFSKNLITSILSFSIVIGLIATLIIPTISSGASAEVSITGLHVVGNKILNSQNQPVSLRGVDKQGSEYMCLYGAVFDGPADAGSVAALKTWNINVVRLPINEQCWLGINGLPANSTATAYQNSITSYVSLLNASNIAVIIDLQWTAAGTAVANQLTPMPDADHAAAFWTSVANKFKTNRSIIFDLFNEPWPDNNGNSVAAWKCLRDGGTCPQVSYQAAGMQKLVTTVRATGAPNIIMVPGLQFTNTMDQWKTYKPFDPTGQLAASWHSYAIQGCNNTTCWNNVIKPIMASVPLIVGEIGQNDCQSTYIEPLMTFLDNNGGHYLAWTWTAYPDDPNACRDKPTLLATDSTRTPSWTPTTYGLGFKNHLLALASSSASSSTSSASSSVTGTPGTWINVTPSSINLASNSGTGLGPNCSNFGTRTVQVDPLNPSNVYTLYDCQGLWKSTNYGDTWTRIDNNATAANFANCSGGITLTHQKSTDLNPTLYAGCIRDGNATGTWKSTDGGVSWTKLTNAVFLDTYGLRQDFYAPVVDPYDDQHLLIASHEFDVTTILQSTNGGATWTSVTLNPTILGPKNISPSIAFIDTGNATTTRSTFLLRGSWPNNLGTWRTTNGGTSWSKVDNSTYFGADQLYQPNKTGTIYMAGADSALGSGILRSTDYGVTWTNVGNNIRQSVVIGTSKNLYGAIGYPIGAGNTYGPDFQVGPASGNGTWTQYNNGYFNTTAPATPAGLTQGPGQFAVTNNGTNNILLGAMWNSGVWKYVEP